MTAPDKNETDYSADVHDLTERLGSRQPSDNPRGLSGGGGGGMESRLAKLEAYTDTIRSDIASIKPDLKDVRERFERLETNVAHLPSKGYINKVVLAAIVLIGAFITFQGQIQSLFGTYPTLPH